MATTQGSAGEIVSIALPYFVAAMEAVDNPGIVVVEHLLSRPGVNRRIRNHLKESGWKRGRHGMYRREYRGWIISKSTKTFRDYAQSPANTGGLREVEVLSILTTEGRIRAARRQGARAPLFCMDETLYERESLASAPPLDADRAACWMASMIRQHALNVPVPLFVPWTDDVNLLTPTAADCDACLDCAEPMPCPECGHACTPHHIVVVRTVGHSATIESDVGVPSHPAGHPGLGPTHVHWQRKSEVRKWTETIATLPSGQPAHCRPVDRNGQPRDAQRWHRPGTACVHCRERWRTCQAAVRDASAP